MKTRTVGIISGVIAIIIIIGVLALILQESKNEYKVLPKEPQLSGPFQIDRSEYAIGEKIFLIVDGLKFDEFGQIQLMRPVNSTHQKLWTAIPFDGAAKSKFNFYFEPKLEKMEEFCSVDDLTGKWSLVFNGTNYANLDFEVNTKVVPGTPIEPVC